MDLASIASQLVDGGGILASDESPPTLGKRLVKAGLENDEASCNSPCVPFFLSFSLKNKTLNLDIDQTKQKT